MTLSLEGKKGETFLSIFTCSMPINVDMTTFQASDPSLKHPSKFGGLIKPYIIKIIYIFYIEYYMAAKVRAVASWSKNMIIPRV